MVSIEIFPGVPENKKLLLVGKGNESLNQPISDLIITIKSKKHNIFTRNGSDLIMTYTISLSEALNSVPLLINSLEGRRLDITMDEIISPQTIKKVKEEGLPFYNETILLGSKKSEALKKGDLYVKFNITFPKYLPQEAKDEINYLLNN